MMRAVLKLLGVLVLVVLVLLAGAYAYVQFTWQRDYSGTPLPAITASTDPAVIARGEYVANAVAHCSACHMLAGRSPGSPIDWDQPFAGGYVWEIPLFGRFVAANITPDVETGIGGMSDAQLARAIRHAVGRDGRILPFMLLAIGHMSDEDLTGVVSYLRSRPAVRQVNTSEEWGIMARALAGSFTPRLTPVPADVPAGGGPSVARGRYLAEGPAACRECHTQRDDFTFLLVGVPFAGNTTPEADAKHEGFEFVYPNLTPDPETGHITGWDEEAFLKRFRGGRVHEASSMPWENFARMTDDDIRSIYRFLRTLTPVKNLVGPPHRKVGDTPAGQR